MGFLEGGSTGGLQGTGTAPGLGQGTGQVQQTAPYSSGIYSGYGGNYNIDVSRTRAIQAQQAAAAAQRAATQQRNQGFFNNAFNAAKGALGATVHFFSDQVNHAVQSNPVTKFLFSDFGKAVVKGGVKAGTDIFKQTDVGKAVDYGSHVLGAPGRYFGQQSQRANEQKNFNDQATKDSAAFDAMQKGQQDRAQWAIDAFYRGELSSVEAKRAVQLALDDVQRGADTFGTKYKAWSDRINAPQRGGFAKLAGWFQKNVINSPVTKTLWRYTLGTGDQNVPSVATFLQRALLTAGNVLGLHSPDYQNQFWKSPGQNKPLSADEIKAQQAQIGPARKQNAWQQTYNQVRMPGSFLEDMASNPLNWFGGMGVAERIGLKAFVAGGSRASAAFRSGAVLRNPDFRASSWLSSKVPQGVKDFTAWQKGTPGDKALNWLKSQKQVNSQKYSSVVSDLQASRRVVASKFAVKDAGYKGFQSLNDKELALYAKTFQTKGQALKDATSRSHSFQNVDVAKVAKQVQTDRAHFARLYQAEGKGNIATGHRDWYMPTSTDWGSKARLGFQAERQLKTARGRNLSPDEIRQARLLRQVDSAKLFGGRSSADFNKLQSFTDQISQLKGAAKQARNSPKERILRAASLPTRAWKASVLALSPTWYINNFGHNVFVSAQSGGLGRSVRNLFKPSEYKNLPEGVTGHNIFAAERRSKLTDRLYSPGSHVEDAFRAGVYQKRIAEGHDPADALRYVNKEFFNYGDVKNWERPLRAAIPFWQWQKNIARYATEMPFRHPLGTTAYRQFQDKAIDKPYEKLPTRIPHTDAEGNVTYVNKGEFFKDKLHIPGTDKWISTPFAPLARGQFDGLNVHPFLQALSEFGTGKDKWGKSFLGQNPWDRVIDKVPLAKLGQSGIRAMTSKFPTEDWVSKTGYTKQAQGFDPSRSNYKAGLDPVAKFKEAIKGFFGVKSFTFDAKKFDEDTRFANFMKEYTSHDWSHVYENVADPNERFLAKEKLRHGIATKHGFDLEKDIYGGRFSKFDTPRTYIRKQQEARVRAKQSEVYAAYGKIPKGMRRGTGSRTDMIAAISKEIGSGNWDKMFPGFNPFPNVDIGSILSPAKSRRTGGGGKSSAVQVGGKWFKSPASAQRYQAFLKANTPQAIRNRQVATIYKTVAPGADRQAALKAAGLGFTTAPTPSQWKTIRANQAAKAAVNLQKDETTHSGLAPAIAVFKAGITKTLPGVPAMKQKPVQMAWLQTAKKPATVKSL